MLCTRWNFEKNAKFPVFSHKVKSRAQIKYLRHSSQDKNVFNAWLKADTYRSNIKRDIHVKKIKVEKSHINPLLLMYSHFCHVNYIIR